MKTEAEEGSEMEVKESQLNASSAKGKATFPKIVPPVIMKCLPGMTTIVAVDTTTGTSEATGTSTATATIE